MGWLGLLATVAAQRQALSATLPDCSHADAFDDRKPPTRSRSLGSQLGKTKSLRRVLSGGKARVEPEVTEFASMRSSQESIQQLVMMQIREGEDNSELARQLVRTGRPPCWRTALHLPPGTIRRLGPLPPTPARGLSSSEACGGPSSPPQAPQS